MLSSRHRVKQGITKDWLGNETTADDPSHQLPAKDEELRKEVAELRERVKVLERIVTDGRDSRLLAEQIESLRDTSPRKSEESQ